MSTEPDEARVIRVHDGDQNLPRSIPRLVFAPRRRNVPPPPKLTEAELRGIDEMLQREREKRLARRR